MEASTNELVMALNSYWQAFIVKLPAIALGLVIMVIMVTLAGRVAAALIKPVGYLSASPLLRSVSQRAISLIIILLALYIFLKLSGLSEFAVAIMSGTGVLGLILGFAFRDIAENMIASLLLTVQRPFRINDVVQINNYTGVVKMASVLMRDLVNLFTEKGISMPDDAREIVFPEGVPVLVQQGTEEQQYTNPDQSVRQNEQALTNRAEPNVESQSFLDDVSSENDDIRRQADEARAPEQGTNILS